VALSHIVSRPVRDKDGNKLLPGLLVDGAGLDKQALEAIPADARPVLSVDGRWWLDTSCLSKYGLQQQRPAPPPNIKRPRKKRRGTRAIEAAGPPIEESPPAPDEPENSEDET
jgi:hypothetical protein